MALKAATSQKVTHTELDFVFFQKYQDSKLTPVGQASAKDPLLFKQKSASGDKVIYDQFGGGGLFLQRATEESELSQSNVRVTNNVSLSVLEFADAVDVPRNFQMDDQHGVVQGNVQDMARRARLSQDDYAIDRWALGFTSVYTNDAVLWFSASHTTIDGTTVDNLESGALTAGTFETMIVTLGTQKNQGGILGRFCADVAFFPLAELKEGCEILDSENIAGSGNNNINYLSRKYPGLQLRFAAELDATSATAYFVASSEHSCNRWVREDVNTNYIDWSVSRNRVGTYQAAFREVVAPISFEGTVGSSGA